MITKTAICVIAINFLVSCDNVDFQPQDAAIGETATVSETTIQEQTDASTKIQDASAQEASEYSTPEASKAPQAEASTPEVSTEDAGLQDASRSYTDDMAADATANAPVDAAIDVNVDATSGQAMTRYDAIVLSDAALSDCRGFSQTALATFCADKNWQCGAYPSIDNSCLCASNPGFYTAGQPPCLAGQECDIGGGRCLMPATPVLKTDKTVYAATETVTATLTGAPPDLVVDLDRQWACCDTGSSCSCEGSLASRLTTDASGTAAFTFTSKDWSPLFNYQSSTWTIVATGVDFNMTSNQVQFTVSP